MVLARAELRLSELIRLAPSLVRYPRALPTSMQSLHAIAQEVGIHQCQRCFVCVRQTLP